MCRLFGAVSKGPVYYDLFEEFADLAVVGNTPRGGPDEKGHRDGWGLACFHNGKLRDLVRGVGSAQSDPKYFQAAWRIAKTNIDRKAGEALVLVAHIRRASPGMPIGPEWSHPFVETKGDRTWAFAHNGGLARVARGEDAKVSDSQVLFRTLLGNLEGPDPEQVAKATKATVESVRAEFGYTGLNFLISDGQWLHAFREYQENGDYYTLYHDDFGEAVLMCSQPILGMRDNLLVEGYLLSASPSLEVVKTRVL